MSHEGFEQPWMSAGPLIPRDWFSMPEFVTKWNTPDLGAIPSFPVGYSGGTVTFRPDPPPIPLPAVVLDPQGPPPIIPVGTTNLPPGPLAGDPEETVALDDWVNAGIDLWRASQQPTVWQAPAQFAGASLPAGGTPGTTVNGASASGLPKGMYMDVHGHLVHRRKRRRPCITQTDLGLAHQIAGLPNNANVRMFLAKCVH